MNIIFIINSNTLPLPFYCNILVFSKFFFQVAESTPDKEEEQGPPPEGNGGATDTYAWTQTLKTVEVSVPIKPGLKSRDIHVDIKGG